MGDERQFSYHDPGQAADSGLTARTLLSSIRQHLAVVVVICLSLGTAGAILGLGLPARSQAEAVLIVHLQPQRISDLREVPPDPLAVVRTEVDVLQSRLVIEPVVRSLSLWRLPEFRKSKYPGGWRRENLETNLETMWNSVRGAKTEPSREPMAGTALEDTDQPSQEQIDETVEKYARLLQVQTDGHSMTIRVSYQASTPELAAAIVNANIESYENLQVQSKKAAAQRANSWLAEKVAKVRDQLQAADTAVARYRDKNHLTGTAKDRTALSQQLATLNSQLIAARADLASSEARAAQIGADLGKTPDTANAPEPVEAVTSQTMRVLRDREAQLVQREAELAVNHGDAYPELERVRSSLKNLREQIAHEIRRSRAAALEVVERSRAREGSMQQSIEELTKRVNSSDAGLQQLQGEAESFRTALHELQSKAEGAEADSALITPNATLVSPAKPSSLSKSMKAPLLAVVGGFVGLTLGSLLAAILELRDKTFRTSTQIEQHVAPRTVSATPRARRRARRSPADVILDDNRSVFAEAFRLSWANIQLAVNGVKPTPLDERRSGTVLGITSAASGEGKSTHALAFARTAGLAGERVVLVDADLRRAGVSQLLGHSVCYTVNDFLQGRCKADDVIAIEERSGIHFVPSTPGKAAWTSQDLRRFADLIDHLKRQFAIVIIDLPPVLGLAETVRLMVVTDGIALIIRWGRTERHFVLYAMDALRSAGVPASAAILNDVDLKAQHRRGYYDRTVVYTDKRLYRAAQAAWKPPSRKALPAPADMAGATPERSAKEEQVRPIDRGLSDNLARSAATSVAASKSDIVRLYDTIAAAETQTESTCIRGRT